MASGVISSIGTAAMVAALSRSWAGMEPGYGAAWRATAQRAGSVLSAAFLSMLLVIPGLLLCFIPGVVAMVKLTFCDCFVMDAGHAGPQSLASSSKLTQGRFWLVLGFMLLVTAATILPFILVMAGLDSLLGLGRSWEARGAVQAILSVPVIYVTVFSFVFYKALRGQVAPESGMQV
jgi:hypothetical protein